MTFYSRPDLSDLQFKQEKDSELHLSGTTHISTITGFTLNDGSAGGQVLVTASGASLATNGFVLTYDNSQGVIKLSPSSASGGTTCFDTDRTTTRSGIPAVCVGGACTLNNFLEGYFFPAVGPSSSISIATGGASREFGDNAVGNLCYQAIRETNQICLVAISDDGIPGYDEFCVTNPIAGDCCGTLPYTYPGNCPIPPTGTSQTSASFQVCVADTSGCADVDSATISWRNKRFTLKSSTLYTDGTISGVLSGGVLSTSKANTINTTFNNEFFYYIYPSSFGTPSFTVNGLPNNAWGNAGTGTLYKFNYTNTNGYENQYYVARSDSRITGSFNIVIS